MQFKRFGCESLPLKRASSEPPTKLVYKNTYVPLNVSHKMPKVLPLRCPSLYSLTHTTYGLKESASFIGMVERGV